MHHEQACREAAGLEKALDGTAPRERVGIDTDATLRHAPADHVIGHRPANPAPADKWVNVQILHRSHALPVRELQPAASAVPHHVAAVDGIGARRNAHARDTAGVGALSAVHSPIQRPDHDQLSGIFELPAERALKRSITPVQADQDSAAPHNAQLAHSGGVQLDQAPDVAFKGKPGAS